MPLYAGEGGLTAVAYPTEIIQALARIAEADPDREVCGFVVRLPGGGLAVEPIPNEAAAGEARVRFTMSPLHQLRVLRELDRVGGVVAAIFHSHVEGEARLSRADIDEATAGGAPLWPGAELLIVGLRAGRCREIRRYRLGATGFAECPLD